MADNPGPDETIEVKRRRQGHPPARKTVSEPMRLPAGGRVAAAGSEAAAASPGSRCG